MMIDVRLQNVLVTDGVRSEENPDLYVRTGTRPLVRDDGSCVLGEGTVRVFDFATYLNALSWAKWRLYTCVDHPILHLEIKGACDVTFVAYDAVVGQPKRRVLDTLHLEADTMQTHDFSYPADQEATFFSFEIACENDIEIRNAYYYAEMDEADVREVELALGMTTFKKEEFVLPNIELIKREVLGSGEAVSGHLTVHVVDNGRTLDVSAVEGDRVHVHPNPNTGGAGGFTRAMMEAMEQEPQATHIILMDDDVRVLPEAIKRTYNLLTLVRQEWVGAFVSGAMLSMEQADDFREDTGWVRPDGTYGPYKELGENHDWYLVSSIEGMTHVETDEPHHENRYAGWWYCCIPVANIRESGLPLPLFIRADDAEYGNRAARGFITMNGICLWHMTFFNKFSASLDRYQFQRNSFIAQATTGVYEHVDFMVNFHYNVLLDLKTFYYDGVEMSLRALEDYMKGPQFLMHVNGQQLLGENAAYNEKLVPVSEIEDEALRGLDFIPTRFYEDEDRTIPVRLLDYLTYNGQRGPRILARGGLGVIPYDGWYYPVNEIRGKEALLAVTTDGKLGVLRKKDRARFRELLARYKRLRREYEARKDEVRAQWAAAREELTSVEFWKRYLREQAEG